MINSTTDVAVASTVVTVSGVAWWVDNWLGIAVTIISVLTLAVNVYFKCRQDKRDKIRLSWEGEEHKQNTQGKD